MEVDYSETALVDKEFWKKSGNKGIQKRIGNLIANVCETPFEGIGKPELLRHSLSGLWSRRIDSEHRLVYEITERGVFIHSMHGHYKVDL